MEAKSLLDPNEPAPFEVVRENGASAYFLTCDHGGNRLPRTLGTLGLPAQELERHFAWDIGAAALARSMADALDSFLIIQNYSRLVIDCNRPPHAPSSIARVGETTRIPGNLYVSPTDAVNRRSALFEPYHDRIRTELDARNARGRLTILVTVHSFTPVFMGKRRPWHVGVLYNRDARLANALLTLFRAEQGLVVGDNQPYSVCDESDYTIPIHGEQRALLHVELEVRQDLLADATGQSAWARRLVGALKQAQELLMPQPFLRPQKP